MPLNLASRLTRQAEARPDAAAVVEPLGYDRAGKRRYRSITFRELDEDSDRIARGLRAWGVPKGARLALLVRPGIDFIALVFGLLKAGTVVVLIDPGMGRGNLIECLAEAEPDGFVAIPQAQAVRAILRRRFPKAKWNVTVGRRWFWGGKTLAQLRNKKGSELLSELTIPEKTVLTPFSTTADDPAAIIFTTGSTGPPKGVLFTHGNFDAQVREIQDFYGIRAGEIDLPCFPMFGLFNCLMGVTAVIPEMDPTRPAQVDPRKILEAAGDWRITQAFGSPAVWNRVGRYCEEHKIKLPTLRRVLSAGAPVPSDVLRRMKDCIHPEGDIHTPYGATEALPVASISASERLAETDARTLEGAGVCVGRKFPSIAWKVIRIVDGPIESFDEIEDLPPGEIGELIVNGPQVTRCYVTRIEANRTGKILQGRGERGEGREEGGRGKGEGGAFDDRAAAEKWPGNESDGSVWHRMGDAGYFDAQDRFWFCGRVAHRVLTPHGPLYPIRCEAIVNRHPDVFRSALVGVGPPGEQRPIIIVESLPGKMPQSPEAEKKLLMEIRQLAASSPLTAAIHDFLLHPAFPVDIRHNAKIFREKLAAWAERLFEK
ncbi:MAG: AMP-binding protein [Pirellulales bacterium]|nr:AMP-binding protein [Pirellulales bacterium]